MTAEFLPHSKARVVREWQTMYPDPIVVKSGDAVALGRRDPEWPGWVWCTNEAGKGGWAPEKIIAASGERGRMLADFSAVELTIRVGDELTLHAEESGWYWATNEAGHSGWAPGTHVELIT